MEGIINFGPSVVIFLLTSGSRRWYIVGAYVPPNDAPAIYCVEQDLEEAPRGVEVILLGGLNVRLQEPHNKHKEELAMALANCGMVNMTTHFTQWWR